MAYISLTPKVAQPRLYLRQYREAQGPIQYALRALINIGDPGYNIRDPVQTELNAMRLETSPVSAAQAVH